MSCIYLNIVVFVFTYNYGAIVCLPHFIEELLIIYVVGGLDANTWPGGLL